MVLILILLLLVIVVNLDAKIKLIRSVAGKWQDVVKHWAAVYFLPAPRLFAIIAHESSGNPEAIGRAGEIGLMQLTPGALTDFNSHFHKTYSLEDLKSPDVNVEVGAGYFRMLLDQMGNIDDATRAYNVGAGRARKDSTAGLTYLLVVRELEIQIS